MRYKITLGDYSSDGHGIKQDYLVEVTGSWTLAQLHENYLKNVAEWGFSPHDFAEAYEDNTMKPVQVQKLLAAGLDPAVFGEEVWTQEDYDERAVQLATRTPWSTLKNYEVGTAFLQDESMIDVCMFFVLHGLESVSWTTVSDDVPTLLGGWSGPTIPGRYAGQIGYGLFGN